MVKLSLTNSSLPQDIISFAYNFGSKLLATKVLVAEKALQVGRAIVYFKAKKVLDFANVTVLPFSSRLVFSPRLKEKKESYSSDGNVSWTVSADDQYKVGEENLVYGNYSFFDKDLETGYSIKAPSHNLAKDYTTGEVAGWSTYAWTTNITGRDVYTAFSPVVYGTYGNYVGSSFPSEESFLTPLIIGAGLDSKGELVIAQLVKIPKDYGYYGITVGDKKPDGSFYEVYAGNKKSAEERALQLKGYFSEIFVNKDDKKVYFVEFLSDGTREQSVDDKGKAVSQQGSGIKSDTESNGWTIVERIDSGRIPQQWFYVDNRWIQYNNILKSEFVFKGLSASAELNKTEYSMTAKDSFFYGLPISLFHKAVSLDGTTADGTSSSIDILRLANTGIVINTSSFNSNIGDTITVTGYDSKCLPLQVTGPSGFSSSTSNTGLTETVTLTYTTRDECADSSGKTLTLTASNGYQPDTQTIGITVYGTYQNMSIIGPSEQNGGTYDYNVSGGVAPYSWSIAPDGGAGCSVAWAINAATGLVTFGQRYATITVEDACGRTATKDVKGSAPSAFGAMTNNGNSITIGDNGASETFYKYIDGFNIGGIQGKTFFAPGCNSGLSPVPINATLPVTFSAFSGHHITNYNIAGAILEYLSYDPQGRITVVAVSTPSGYCRTGLSKHTLIATLVNNTSGCTQEHSLELYW